MGVEWVAPVLMQLDTVHEHMSMKGASQLYSVD